MPEPRYLTTTRESYDVVAEDYADLVKPLFDNDPLGRGMLAAFAELVQGPVVEVGCGPGHVTAYLHSLGLSVFGIDLSPKMVEIARRTYPLLRFEVGTMTGLELTDSSVAGVVSWWSIVHTPPEVSARPHRRSSQRRRVLRDGSPVDGRSTRADGVPART